LLLGLLGGIIQPLLSRMLHLILLICFRILGLIEELVRKHFLPAVR
jgi:hypothetical protein